MSKSYFTTKKLVTLAILAAVGSALMWLEIPFIPPFKLDASDTAVIVGTVLYGPVGGAIIAFIKAVAHFIFLSSGDFGIGELIAFVASLTYALPFYYSMRLVRKFTKDWFLVRIIPTIVGTAALTVILPLLNFLFFFQIWALVTMNQFLDYGVVLNFALGTVLGNLVKGAGLSALFILLSLRLQYVADKLDIYNEQESAFTPFEELTQE